MAISADVLLAAHVDQLENHIQRLVVLTDHQYLTGDYLEPMARIRQHVGVLQERASQLRRSMTAPTDSSADCWKTLVRLTRDGQALADLVLGYVGGRALSDPRSGVAPIDGGIAERAGRWLNELRTAAHLDPRLVAVIGAGELLDPEMAIARIPLLEGDPWYLPLLGRALGQLATAESSAAHRRILQPVVARLRPEAGAKVEELFVEMFTLGLVGPGYALAVFGAELDYGEPNLEVRGRLAPVHRAAALLTALNRMNSRSQGKYASVLAQLGQLWSACVASAGERDVLAIIQQQRGAAYQTLFDEAVVPLLNDALDATEARWLASGDWYRTLRRGGTLPDAATTGDTEELAALWQHRLEEPGDAAGLLERAERLRVPGRRIEPRIGDGQLSPAAAVARLRVDYLNACCERLRAALEHELIVDDGPIEIAGRFLRQLSAEGADTRRAQQQAGSTDPPPPRVWVEIARARESATLLEKAGLDFVGGLAMRDTDHEPAQVLGGNEDGPCMTELANRMLRRYARMTGVNWSGRVIIGRGSLIAEDTRVVQLRFPDWSVWTLPIMAHEFGHVVALETRAFHVYLDEQFRADHDLPPAAVEGHPHARDMNRDEYLRARAAHFHEIFADVFATYTMGPAWACCAVFHQFSPAEAFEQRGRHPTHDERVAAILDTLKAMNVEPNRPYDQLLEWLDGAWADCLAASAATPEDGEVHAFLRAQARRWAAELLRRVVDRYYRLGAAYTQQRWAMSLALANRQTHTEDLRWEDVADIATQYSVLDPTYDDVLNALWWRRVLLLTRPAEQYGTPSLKALTVLAARLGKGRMGLAV